MLADKVIATHKAAISSPDHSTFLKNFGKFQVANLTESVIPADKLVLEMLTDLQIEVSQLRRTMVHDDNRQNKFKRMEEFSKVLKGIDIYRTKNPTIKLQDLRGKNDLYSFLAEEIDAPNLFPSHREFVERVDHVIENMLATE